jgi:hypothetical protein
MTNVGATIKAIPYDGVVGVPGSPVDCVTVVLITWVVVAVVVITVVIVGGTVTVGEPVSTTVVGAVISGP